MSHGQQCPRCVSQPLVDDPFGAPLRVCPRCGYTQAAPRWPFWRVGVLVLILMSVASVAAAVVVSLPGRSSPPEPALLASAAAPSVPGGVPEAVRPESLREAPESVPPAVRPQPGLPELPPVAPLPEVPSPAVPAEPLPPRNVLGQYQKLGEEDLRKLLAKVPDISIDRVPGTSHAVVENARLLLNSNVPFLGPLHNLPTRRADLAGLPMVVGKESYLGREPAENLHALSGQLRALARQAIGEVASARTGQAQSARLLELLLASEAWKSPDAIPTLLQMMTPESAPVRKVLVEFLAQIPGPRASAALAMRAVTDLSPEVRRLAVAALKARPREEVRGILLAGVLYPFPALAGHAAEALVMLDDRASLPLLVQLLEPSAGNEVREVVKVNHVRNCVLCHAPSFQPTDLLRAVVPGAGAVTASYGGGTVQDDFIRADVTYLRQDFSIQHLVTFPNQRPSLQRYDYLVRVRKPTETEKAAQTPPRQPVLFALRELTGKDAGLTSRDWEPVVQTLTNPATLEQVTRQADRDWRQFTTTLLP